MKSLSFGSFGVIALPGTETENLLIPSSEEMAGLDAATIHAGTSATILMERAGAAVVEEVLLRYSTASRVLVLCGAGNNGGDGLVVAHLLRAAGRSVTVVAIRSERYSDEWRRQMPRVENILYFPDISTVDLAGLIDTCDLVIDGLLGTGQRSSPRGNIAGILGVVRERCAIKPAIPVVSIDVPTGINCDTGEVYTPHINAHLTVAIELAKRGVFQFPARSVCGRMIIRSVGIARQSPVEFGVLAGDSLSSLVERIPSVRADGHKGHRGHVLVVAGSCGMAGAAVLVSMAALRTGAGLVTRVMKSAWASAAIGPEIMDLPLQSMGATFSEEDLPEIEARLDSVSSVVVGPGIGSGVAVESFILKFLTILMNRRIPTVIDAGALRVVASNAFRFHGGPFVITPHPGEAAALLGCTTVEVQADRFSAARRLAKEYEVVALLKGAGTIVYCDDHGIVVPRGDKYMATAGSGDVLSGVISPFLARSMNPFESASLGGYVHGLAGERAVLRSRGPIIASDIVAELPGVVGSFRR